MRFALVILATCLGLTLASPSANAVGCITGGAAGALAGHMAGHGILGAISGCIAGRAWHNHTMRQQDLQSQQDYVQRRQQFDPSYKNPWANNQ
jgi:outer membrane lipoprotein SlyB